MTGGAVGHELIGKEQRLDGPTRKLYDISTTPLPCILDSGRAEPAKIGSLVELYTAVSPLTLKGQIDRRLAAMPASLEVTASARRNPAAPPSVSFLAEGTISGRCLR